jgi:hypothetical protein
MCPTPALMAVSMNVHWVSSISGPALEIISTGPPRQHALERLRPEHLAVDDLDVRQVTQALRLRRVPHERADRPPAPRELPHERRPGTPIRSGNEDHRSSFHSRMQPKLQYDTF